MDQFIKSFPTGIGSWIGSLIVMGGSISFVFSRVRKSDMDVLRQSNKDLRDSAEDNRKRIVVMEVEMKMLTEKVLILEKRNKTLEDLVVTALKQYFFENPNLASSFKEAILPTP